MISPWQLEARRELLTRRSVSGAWSYRRAGTVNVEPTVVACLSLLASGDDQSASSDLETCNQSARWLTAIQRADGSLPLSSDTDSPVGWPTPYAVLLWSALAGYRVHASHAAGWLLVREGKRIFLDKTASDVVGHDTQLLGWPWIESTHSWLEPTALAILALCRLRLAAHRRVRAGVDLILNRALDSGGWNYGNKSFFGTELRPQPGTTGLALLALAAAGASSPAVERGLLYLQKTVVGLRAPVSLGWAILGLRAHGQCPAEADLWLADACSRCTHKPDAAMGLALALLASSQRGVSFLVDRGDAS